ncbi:MAG: surface lipoprotein assembly modifier, partial [Leisingera sp.]
RISAGQDYKLTPQRSIGARLQGDRQFGVRANDLDTLRGDLSYSVRLQSGLNVSSNLSAAYSSSADKPSEYSELSLRTHLTLPKPILGATARFGLSARRRDYDSVSMALGGGSRQDDKLSADFSLTFKQIDYYGFNPTLRISGSTTDSNINLYKSNRFGLNIGIQSAF